MAPDLSRLTLIARAITPPRRARRYDTRFFCVGADQVAGEVSPRDSELIERHWLTVAETQALDLPNITRVVLEVLFERLKATPALRPVDRVPYYFARNGVFHRRFI